jgi:hypothetical protein
MSMDATASTEKRFAADITEHEMIVLHDDGLYRHVRFKRPGTMMYYFDLVTYPGTLVISGDMGYFMFRRLDDMFEFFAEPRVNVGYWAEKCVANSGLQRHSEEKFTALVAKQFTEAKKNNSGGHEDDYWDHIWQRLEEDVLAEAHSDDTAIQSVYDWNDTTGETLGFEIYLDYDWDTKDYTYQFLWCLHAIQWGVAKYRSQR